MRHSQTLAQHDRLQRELNEERVAALLRISHALESLIGQLHAARERIARLHGTDRDRETAAYRDLHTRAVKYRWYLEVQREALGMRQHHSLDEFYAIPGRDV
jgi:hypothetical protein